MRSLVGVAGVCVCVCVLVPRPRREVAAHTDPSLVASLPDDDEVNRTTGGRRSYERTRHEVVLVGGSTRIPKVRAQLKKHFGGREPSSAVHPDEARLDLSSYDD